MLPPATNSHTSTTPSTAPPTVMATTGAFVNVAAPVQSVQSSELAAWQGIAVVCTVVVVITVVAVVSVMLLWRWRRAFFKVKDVVESESTTPEEGGAQAYSGSITGSTLSEVGTSRPASSEIFLPTEILHKHQHDIISMDPSRTGGVWF